MSTDYPLELNNLRERGFNMAAFVPLLYNIARDMRIGQKGIRRILEIGVRTGVSTNAFLYGLRDRGIKHLSLKLYSIDIEDCSSAVKDKTLLPYWNFIQGDSRKIEWNREISVLLIDGAHDYETCLADYKKYESFVTDGGLILMHDISWEQKGPIKVFWDDVKYSKSVLPLTKSGLGVIYKKNPPYYDKSKIRWEDKKIAKGK